MPPLPAWFKITTLDTTTGTVRTVTLRAFDNIDAASRARGRGAVRVLRVEPDLVPSIATWKRQGWLPAAPGCGRRESRITADLSRGPYDVGDD